MDKKEAYKKMALLMKKERDIFSEISNNGLGVSISDMDNINEEIEKRLENAKYEIKSFGQELAADPQFSEEIISWMIDVEGQYSESGDEDMKEALTSFDFKEYLDKSSVFAFAIQRELEQFGIKITDRGGSISHWHLGVPCNNKQADFVCEVLYRKFGKTIRSGYIKVKKKFWSHRLPRLYNNDDIDKFLSEE